ncbi:kinesin light chain 1 [Cordyceps fumosorosea ARSEF 2679]|uniref:Kinesin light chain 1 n=1 Tax=Cordyceps fumosorosea (strain ARSEF 2679) TaxID=1081104 RepID=A0A167TRW6_CORFA|nr:kinesin light chain 1 [Cordyceps fumosorosea ARSEF 2679]OAA60881.1 kinesin light chain 1 [Cordyceps fumosorosea ARSEF 2679]
MSPELNSYEDRMLYSTWNITFSSIEQRNKLSANLVRFWAYLNKDDVWFELLKQDIPNSPDWFRQLGDELCFTQAMRVLSQFRLVEPNSWIAEPIETGGYSMHSCVHSWTVNVLNAERDNALAKLAVQCIASHVPRRGEPFWWITQGRLRLHAAQYPCDTIDKLSATDNLEYAMFRLANLALDQDNLEAAEPLLERTLKLQQTSRGLDDLATLSTMNVMGALRRRQTRFDEAHDSYTRVLGSAGSTTDEAVACRLDAMYNLGCLHLYKDQPDEAERFFQQAQSAYEKAEGYEDKLFELDLLDYMGIVHRKLARLDKAVKLHRKAVEGKTELLGRGHMSTLDSTVNLALALFWQQELGEAGKLLWNVCMGRVQALGSRHILTMDAFSLWDNVQFLSSNPKEAEKIPGMLERGASGGVGSSGGEPDMCHVNFAAFFRFICRQRPGLRWHSLYKDPEL